jgi:molybdopterin-guanine dinucleotide biosynthesis protein A
LTVLVAVLAGGRGSRLGEPKALADLLGRPLISWPLAAAADSGLRTVVVAKPSTALPDLDVEVLLEPEQPQHPLAGLVRALEEGGPVIAVGCDMPFVTARVLTRLAGLEGNAVFDDQPFPGRYEPGAIGVLSAALGRGEPVREALRVLDPLRLRLPDALATASVNTPEQLAEARRLLG